MAETDIRPGDWVRFQQMGEIVTAVVQYVKARDIYPTWKMDIITDRGTVEHDKVLEIRRSTPESQTP